MADKFESTTKSRVARNEIAFGPKIKPIVGLPRRRTGPEWFQALIRLKKGKAAGPSGLSAEMLRALHQPAAEAIGFLLDTCMLSGILPPSFLYGYIYPIPKRGATDVGDARPISLLEVPLKCSTAWVMQHMRDELDKRGTLTDSQYGFRPGRGCPQAVAQLIGIIEDAKENHKELHLVLVDIRKAFDSIEPWSLREAYEAAGFSDELTRFLAAMDGTGTAAVITPSGLALPRAVQRGVRQGETLSPLKFILWLDLWLRTLEHNPEAPGGYALRDGTKIRAIAYADDLALIADTHAGALALLTSLSNFLIRHGVALNPDKSFYVSTLEQPEAIALAIQCFDLETCLPVPAVLPHRGRQFIFKYLGISLNLDLDWDKSGDELNTKMLKLISLVKRKCVTLCHAFEIVDSVIRGRIAYYAQVSQIPASVISGWDNRIAALLKKTASLPMSAAPHQLRAPRPAGLGIPSAQAVQTATIAAESVILLNSNDTSGQVMRTRWNACKGDLLKSPVHSATKRATHTSLLTHHQYALFKWGLRIEPSDILKHRLMQAHQKSDIPLARVLPAQALDSLLSTNYRWLSEVLHLRIRAGGSQLEVRSESSLSRRASWGTKPSFEWITPLTDMIEEHNGLSKFREYAIDTEFPLDKVMAGEAPDTRFASDITYNTSEPIGTTCIFVDGSYDAEHRHGGAGAGWAAVVHSGPAIGCSEFNITQANGKTCTVRGTYGAASSLGAQRAYAGSMEILAVRAACYMLPAVHADIYTDYDRIHRAWKRIANPPLRRLVRGADANLILDISQAVNAREARGLRTVLHKVAAHGRDQSQAEWLTEGNCQADALAKHAAAHAPDQASCTLKGGLKFVIAHNEFPVYADPRRLAMNIVGERTLREWALRPTHGWLARHIDKVWTHSRAFSSKKRTLVNTECGVPTSLKVRLRFLGLRTPTQLGRTLDDMASLFARNAKGDSCCPLCHARCSTLVRGDTQHLLLCCPALEATRESARTLVAALLRGCGPVGWWTLAVAPTTIAQAIANSHRLRPLCKEIKAISGADSGCATSSFITEDGQPHTEDLETLAHAAAASSVEYSAVTAYAIMPRELAARAMGAKINITVMCLIPAGRWWLIPPSSTSGTTPKIAWSKRTAAYEIVIAVLGVLPAVCDVSEMPALAAALGNACFKGCSGLTWNTPSAAFHLDALDKEAMPAVTAENLLCSSKREIDLASEESGRLLLPWLGMLPKSLSPRLKAAYAATGAPPTALAEAFYNIAHAAVFSMWHLSYMAARNALLGAPFSLVSARGNIVVLRDVRVVCPPSIAEDTGNADSLPSAIIELEQSLLAAALGKKQQRITAQRATASWVRLASETLLGMRSNQATLSLSGFIRICEGRGISRRIAQKAFDYVQLIIWQTQKLPPLAEAGSTPSSLSWRTQSSQAINSSLSSTPDRPRCARSLSLDIEEDDPRPPQNSPQSGSPPAKADTAATHGTQRCTQTPIALTPNHPAVRAPTTAVPRQRPWTEWRPQARAMVALQNTRGLGSETWLNDEVVDAAGRLINMISGDAFATSSYLLSRAREARDHMSVMPWYQWQTLLELRVILMPYYSDSHWILVAAFPRTHEIVISDSAYSATRGDDIAKEAGNLLSSIEANIRHMPSPAWIRGTTPPQVLTAQQHDGSSCGIFMLARMIETALSVPASFSQDNVNTLRTSLAESITRGTLLRTACPPWCRS